MAKLYMAAMMTFCFLLPLFTIITCHKEMIQGQSVKNDLNQDEILNRSDIEKNIAQRLDKIREIEEEIKKALLEERWRHGHGRLHALKFTPRNELPLYISFGYALETFFEDRNEILSLKVIEKKGSRHLIHCIEKLKSSHLFLRRWWMEYGHFFFLLSWTPLISWLTIFCIVGILSLQQQAKNHVYWVKFLAFAIILTGLFTICPLYLVMKTDENLANVEDLAWNSTRQHLSEYIEDCLPPEITRNDSENARTRTKEILQTMDIDEYHRFEIERIRQMSNILKKKETKQFVHFFDAISIFVALLTGLFYASSAKVDHFEQILKKIQKLLWSVYLFFFNMAVTEAALM